MASLPCAYAARALAMEAVLARGAATVIDLIGADNLLGQLVGDGFELHAC
jgi:hypothetical protein